MTDEICRKVCSLIEEKTPLKVRHCYGVVEEDDNGCTILLEVETREELPLQMSNPHKGRDRFGTKKTA